MPASFWASPSYSCDDWCREQLGEHRQIAYEVVDSRSPVRIHRRPAAPGDQWVEHSTVGVQVTGSNPVLVAQLGEHRQRTDEVRGSSPYVELRNPPTGRQPWKRSHGRQCRPENTYVRNFEATCYRYR